MSGRYMQVCLVMNLTSRSLPHTSLNRMVCVNAWTGHYLKNCLLIWSHLLASHWDFSVLHANWARNRFPTNGLNGDIPYEAWMGKECQLENMHTFGCLLQCLKVEHDKNKKSEKCASETSYGVFLGMAIGQSGYLIFDPNRIEVGVYRR